MSAGEPREDASRERIGTGPVDLSHDEIRLAGGVRVRWDSGFLLFRHPTKDEPFPLTQIGAASTGTLHRLLARAITREADTPTTGRGDPPL